MFRFRKDNCKILLFLSALMSVCLSGCSIDINVDAMLTPPKLSGEQEQIYQALENTAGTGIRLKYPKSGSYLSAFTIADIDGEPGDEAIVFYEKTGAAVSESGLRINILDKIDNQWQSICDRSAEGSEIEKIMISPLGDSDRINIIVGYSTANQSEKYLSVYTYEENYLNQTLRHSYALFDIVETNRHPDLMLLGAVTASEPAYAAVYRLAGDGLYHEYKYQFADNYTDYHQLICSQIPDGRTAFYIDAATGTANLQTEILCLEEPEDSEIEYQLSNLLQRCGWTASGTVRRAGLPTMDIDGDGTPEIPVQTVFPGYTDVAEPEQIRETDWLTMQDNLIFPEYESYYNANDGYLFLLPEAWKHHVTIRNNPTENEIQVCAYDGELTEEMPVLLRIYIAYDEADRDDHLGGGYLLQHTKGTADYLIKPESGHDLSMSAGTLLLYFYFLD